MRSEMNAFKIDKKIGAINNVIRNTKVEDFALNNLFMLSQLRSGGGYQSSVDICGMLHIKYPWSSKTYYRAEEWLAQELIDQNEEIIELNRKREIELSPLVNGVVDLVCCFDYRWQQRGSGNVYNSVSGHGNMVGARTKKVS